MSYTVSNLKAKSHPDGLKITLTWTNPTSPPLGRIKILRNKYHWVFDHTDETKVLYDSDIAIEEYEDSDGLANEFYYYTVIVTTSSHPLPTDYEYAEESRVRCLAISDELKSKEWMLKHFPKTYRRRDVIPTAEGGGGGLLDAFLSVAGAQINILRGTINSIGFQTDPDRAIPEEIRANVLMLGYEVDGMTYDFGTPRRILQRIKNIGKIRGTCPGIIEAVAMLTLWDAQCLDLSSGECLSGATSLHTYDGISEKDTQSSFLTAFSSQNDTTTGFISDPGKAWTIDQWIGGRFIGDFGDVGCIQSSTETTVTSESILSVAVLTEAFTKGVGDYELSSDPGGSDLLVDNVLHFMEGLDIQITDTTVTNTAEIRTISAVDPSSNTVSVYPPLLNQYPAGAVISIAKTFVRDRFYGTAKGVSGTHVLIHTDGVGMGTDTMVGKTVLFAGDLGPVYTVLSNTNDTLYLDGSPDPGVEGLNFFIADYFDTTAFDTVTTARSGYSVYNGTHSFIYSPKFDHETRGTLYDQYNRLYSHSPNNLNGAWALGDVGVFITTPGIVIHGEKYTSGGANVINVVDTSFSINALVGYYVNPNQNQGQLFKIVSNTTNSITLEKPGGTLSVVGQYFYIVSARDRARIVRLQNRLKEFVDMDAKSRVHVLFF